MAGPKPVPCFRGSRSRRNMPDPEQAAKACPPAADLQGRAQAVEEPWLLGTNGWQSGHEGFLFAPLPPSSGVQVIRLLAGARKILTRSAGARKGERIRGCWSYS